jgi:hypothetical protein
LVQPLTGGMVGVWVGSPRASLRHRRTSTMWPVALTNRMVRAWSDCITSMFRRRARGGVVQRARVSALGGISFAFKLGATRDGSGVNDFGESISSIYKLGHRAVVGAMVSTATWAAPFARRGDPGRTSPDFTIAVSSRTGRSPSCDVISDQTTAGAIIRRLTPAISRGAASLLRRCFDAADARVRRQAFWWRGGASACARPDATVPRAARARPRVRTSACGARAHESRGRHPPSADGRPASEPALDVIRQARGPGVERSSTDVLAFVDIFAARSAIGQIVPNGASSMTCLRS